MLKTGLVSVTFRQLPPDRISALVHDAGLDGIEWGGDVHVPPTDPVNAAAVAGMTLQKGLRVFSYGSYFRAGYSVQETFADELAAARALGAPNVRIWAGKKGSAEEDNRHAVADSVRACAEDCRRAGMTLSLEFHRNTLTDHYISALSLADEVAHESLRLYWQPNQTASVNYNRTALRAILPYVSNVHVFTWEGAAKFPLAHGESIWRAYLDILAEAPGDHGLFLEFVCDGTEKQFFEDAATLRSWLA